MRQRRSTSGRRPGRAAATGWRFTGGKAPWWPRGSVSSQRGEMLRVQGAQRSHQLEDLEIPDRYVFVPRRLSPRRSLQRGPNVRAVRRGHKEGGESTAHIRYGGGPAPFHRHHPGGVGHRPGAARGVTHCTGKGSCLTRRGARLYAPTVRYNQKDGTFSPEPTAPKEPLSK